MENNATGRRWSKAHAAPLWSSCSFWPRIRGGRKKNTEAGHENGEPSAAASNGEESAAATATAGDDLQCFLDGTVATIDAPMLSLEEIVAKTGNFSAMYCVGQGSHGRVYYCAAAGGGGGGGSKAPVALKKLDEPLKHLPRKELLSQIAVSSRLKHQNFVELLGYLVADDLLLLAYEFATMGSLHDILHGRKGVQGARRGPAIPWRRRVGVALDAAKGLDYLHQNGVVHRNVRSSNVLLFHGFGAKVADYDLFTQAPDTPTRHISSQILGSFVYHPPEYVMLGVVTSKSDVYSFGVILLELLTGRKPVDDKSPSGHRSLVNWASPQLTPEKVQQIVDPRLSHECSANGIAKLATLAAACLWFEPESRQPMSVVVQALHAVAELEQ